MPDSLDLAETFRRFAVREAEPGDSPLYVAICEAIAVSPELLEVAAQAPHGQPVPNLFLAAIHLLVRREPGSSLAAYFPSIGGRKSPDADLPGHLINLVRANRDGILEVLQTRFVQTNEVRRTACLLPAFAEVYREAARPLALIEAGCSAGLNLLFDRFHYDYGNGTTAGDDLSGVRVDTVARTPIPAGSVVVPPVARRMGVDLNPLDVSDVGDLEWLHALIWPEHADRRDLLGNAAEVMRRERPPLLRGDAIDELERMAATVPEEEALVVFAAFVLNQIPPDRRRDLRAVFERLGRSRPTWFVVMGFADFVAENSVAEDGSTGVWIGKFDGETAAGRRIVRCHPHGRWMELVTEPYAQLA